MKIKLVFILLIVMLLTACAPSTEERRAAASDIDIAEAYFKNGLATHGLKLRSTEGIYDSKSYSPIPYVESVYSGYVKFHVTDVEDNSYSIIFNVSTSDMWTNKNEFEIKEGISLYINSSLCIPEPNAYECYFWDKDLYYLGSKAQGFIKEEISGIEEIVTSDSFPISYLAKYRNFSSIKENLTYKTLPVKDMTIYLLGYKNGKYEVKNILSSLRFSDSYKKERLSDVIYINYINKEIYYSHEKVEPEESCESSKS